MAVYAELHGQHFITGANLYSDITCSFHPVVLDGVRLLNYTFDFCLVASDLL
jgi:hypothetical protein